jgi:hypothetical protein
MIRGWPINFLATEYNVMENQVVKHPVQTNVRYPINSSADVGNVRKPVKPLRNRHIVPPATFGFADGVLRKTLDRICREVYRARRHPILRHSDRGVEIFTRVTRVKSIEQALYWHPSVEMELERTGVPAPFQRGTD